MFFCGVFDGHGPSGHKVSRLLCDVLPSKLSSGIKTSLLNSSSGINPVTGKPVDANDSNGDNTEYDSDNNATHKMSLHSWEAVLVRSFKEMDEELSLDATIDTYCSGATAVTLIKKVLKFKFNVLSNFSYINSQIPSSVVLFFLLIKKASLFRETSW